LAGAGSGVITGLGAAILESRPVLVTVISAIVLEALAGALAAVITEVVNTWFRD
jgi:hypothetical protein